MKQVEGRKKTHKKKYHEIAKKNQVLSRLEDEYKSLKAKIEKEIEEAEEQLATVQQMNDTINQKTELQLESMKKVELDEERVKIRSRVVY